VAYQQAVEETLVRERHVIESHPNLDDQGRAEQLETLKQTVTSFVAVTSGVPRGAALAATGESRADVLPLSRATMSYRRYLAASWDCP
jgi:hypothetical protein